MTWASFQCVHLELTCDVGFFQCVHSKLTCDVGCLFSACVWRCNDYVLSVKVWLQEL